MNLFDSRRRACFVSIENVTLGNFGLDENACLLRVRVRVRVRVSKCHCQGERLRERGRERERYRIAVLHFSSAFNEFPFQLMLYTIGIVVGAAAVAAALLQQQQQRVH